MTYRTPMQASQRDASNGRDHAPALARRDVAGAWAAPAEGIPRCARSACSRGRLRSSHLPIIHGRLRERWAHRCELGRACVGMRGHAWACVGPRQVYKGTRCGMPVQLRRAQPCQTSAAIPACERLHAAHNRCTVQLWRTQVEHAHGCVAWAHLHLCVLDQLEYKVSEEPSSGRATRLVPAHRVPPAAWPSRTSAHDVVA